MRPAKSVNPSEPKKKNGGAKKGGKSSPSNAPSTPASPQTPAGAGPGTFDQDPEGKPKTNILHKIKSQVRKRIARFPLDSSSSSSGRDSPSQCPGPEEISGPPSDHGVLSRQDAVLEASPLGRRISYVRSRKNQSNSTFRPKRGRSLGQILTKSAYREAAGQNLLLDSDLHEDSSSYLDPDFNGSCPSGRNVNEPLSNLSSRTSRRVTKNRVRRAISSSPEPVRRFHEDACTPYNHSNQVA